MSLYKEDDAFLHPYVTQLLYVAAHDKVTLDGLISEFEFDDNEQNELDESDGLDEFVSWVKLRGFTSASIDSDGKSILQITPEGTKWVLGQLWDFSSGEYTGEV